MFSKDRTKSDGHYSSCKECNRTFERKQWFYSRKESKSEYDKERNKKNPEANRKRAKDWYENNKKYVFEYYLNRSHTDLLFILKKRIRSRIYKALKGKKKPNSVVKELGCTIKELKNYLESKFKHGMSWENYGKWHIDHIYPLAKFDLANKEQFAKACHYTNLQPLWARDNQIKGASV